MFFILYKIHHNPSVPTFHQKLTLQSCFARNHLKVHQIPSLHFVNKTRDHHPLLFYLWYMCAFCVWTINKEHQAVKRQRGPCTCIVNKVNKDNKATWARKWQLFTTAPNPHQRERSIFPLISTLKALYERRTQSSTPAVDYPRPEKCRVWTIDPVDPRTGWTSESRFTTQHTPYFPYCTWRRS